jgi:hypothetical protein
LRNYYELAEVIEKIQNGKLHITKNALDCALKDFGWNIDDIKRAYLKLKPEHYYKNGDAIWNRKIVIDIYKAHINGEDIYTHFFIDDESNILVINSFKKL